MYRKPRALVAMSGGVDSSVAALLAQRMGYDCTGVTLKLTKSYDVNQPESSSSASFAIAKEESSSSSMQSNVHPSAIKTAEQVAASLGIPHRVLDYTGEFQSEVIEPFVCAYESGATPNPCIDCNTHIKLGKLLEYARSEGYDKLVTGHYARIAHEQHEKRKALKIHETQGTHGTHETRETHRDTSMCYILLRGVDKDKDQSYFLYELTPDKLQYVLFPLGELTKEDVRAIAKEAGLECSDRPESQDICFVPDGGHAEFIENYRWKPAERGNFVGTDGMILGEHKGIVHYTIGQRKGLGIALGKPVYVKEIRPATNEVVLADESEVFSNRIEIDIKTCLQSSQYLSRVEVVIRYRATPVQATIEQGENGVLSVIFDEPVRAPAKGQAAVFYDGDVVLGGGRILRSV